MVTSFSVRSDDSFNRYVGTIQDVFLVVKRQALDLESGFGVWERGGVAGIQRV